MKKRQHIQAAITRHQSKSHSCVVCLRTDVSVRQRHDFGLRCRASGMQYYPNIVRLCEFMRYGARMSLTSEREETRLGFENGRQLNDREATRLCDGTRWRVHSHLHNQRFGAQISQIKIKF